MLRLSFVSAAAAADALAVGIGSGGRPCPSARAVDGNGVLSRALSVLKGFTGEAEESLILVTPQTVLVLVGLGDADDAPAWRRIGGALFADLAGSGIGHLSLQLDLPPLAAAELAYGLRLRAWRPSSRYRSRPDEEDVWYLSRISVVTGDPAAAEARFRRLAPVAAAAALARDLAAAPANELTPAAFAQRLTVLESLGVTVEILPAAAHGLGLLQAVGQGSAQPPLLAVLRWDGGAPGAAPLALVGKGITFDSGGLSLKEAEGMEEMKGDMAGAAAVAGVLAALAGRQAPVNVVGVLALAENMPSGRATRPGDVVTGHAGISVEIVDTDAEGRLVLADALSYAARRFAPRLMVDLATLTGAVETALGRHKAGLFCADDALAAELLAAAAEEDEPLWRLPLTDHYDEDIRSPIADLRNASWEERAPDHLNAARFLQHFVPEGLSWAHLDIAGTATAEEDGPFAAEGQPTAFGIRLLDRLAERLAGEAAGP